MYNNRYASAAATRTRYSRAVSADLVACCLRGAARDRDKQSTGSREKWDRKWERGSEKRCDSLRIISRAGKWLRKNLGFF